MFGRKKEQTEEDSQRLQVHTIPDLFYGGKDPILYHQKTVQDSTQNTQNPNKNFLGKQAVGSGEKHKLLFLSNKKPVWFISAALFGVVSLIGVYYLRGYFQARSILRLETEAAKQSNAPQAATQSGTSTRAIEPQKSSVVSSTSSEKFVSSSTDLIPEDAPLSESDAEKLNIKFPPFSSSEATDIDKDQLSDKEEEIFDTDSGSWDSDADGYYDGQEVFNLYNPKGFAPVRLIDSGLIKQYINLIFDYRLYYPKDWQVGEVDKSGKQVLLSAVSGDYIEVRAAKDDKRDFTAWFEQHAANQNITDLLQFTNRFEVEGWKRRDSMVAYFPSKGMVYIMVYRPGNVGPAVFKNVMNMMIQSFRPASAGKELPEQVSPASVPGVESSDLDITNTSTPGISEDGITSDFTDSSASTSPSGVLGPQ